MTRVAYPFIKPAPTVVKADGWALRYPDMLQDAPLYLEGWDYNTLLRPRRVLRIDLEACLQQAKLPAATNLDLVVVAFSSATWLKNTVFTRPIQPTPDDIVIEFELAGSELGGTLRLQTAVVLRERPLSHLPFLATTPSSVLWDDEFEIRLQGNAPMFPISVIDFGRAGFPPGAGWYLDIGASLEAPLHASVRLYLNVANSRVVTAFERAVTPTPEDRAILSAIYADVARIMLAQALNSEAEVKEATDKDSLGFAFRHLLMRFYPEEDVGVLRSRQIEHPGDFSAELYSKLEVFNY